MRVDAPDMPIHDVIFFAINKPRLLSQLSTLLSDIELNIREAHVAVKILRSEHLNDETLENEFAHDVAMLREVRHADVVRFIGACMKKPPLCIITEYMPGGNLYEYLHKNRNILRAAGMKLLRAACKSNVDGVANVSLISGRFFVLVGAGGAARALEFGAKSKGARVLIFNRNFERAESLPQAVSGETLTIEQLDAYCPKIGMILANCSAIGMEPDR
uniref:Protein kinase domain-containing protein n=1 Tax=Lactuca sativa TaxID=4236 RepID=A0A9R1WSD3_LACSA|nr:hypothetical protein LSAT_V11C900484080 [Lactuca sativa]